MASEINNDTFYDALVRHQIYLEGYKGGLGAEFAPTAKAIEADFRKRLASLDYERLDELSKAQLKKLVNTMKDFQLRQHDAYHLKLIDDLEDFVNVDYKLVAEIFTDTGIIPKGLFKKLADTPIAGIGEYLQKFLRNVGLGSIVQFEKIMLSAWAEGSTKAELLTKLIGERIGDAKQRTLDKAREALARPRSIVGKLLATVRKAAREAPKAEKNPEEPEVAPKRGEPLKRPEPFVPPVAERAPRPVANTEDFVGGLLNRTRQQNQGAINTALQHLTQGIVGFIAEKYSNYYQWVSVIDSRTTEICRERDGTVYAYGEGPMPPAHINCRSMVIPWYNRAETGIEPGGDYMQTGAANNDG